MIFAAGLGTRLRPITNNKPKALVEINGITLLERTINTLIDAGFNEIVINVHHFANQVIEFINKKQFNAKIAISDESRQLLDTGGGLLKASFFFDDAQPFLIHNVDILSEVNLRDLYKQHNKNKSIATLVVQNRKSSRYLLFDNNDALCGWKNIKTNQIKRVKINCENYALAFSGIQIVDPKIFELITEKGVFSIIDLYLRLAQNHKISAYLFNGFWLDIGKPESLNAVKKIYSKTNQTH